MLVEDLMRRDYYQETEEVLEPSTVYEKCVSPDGRRVKTSSLRLLPLLTLGRSFSLVSTIVSSPPGLVRDTITDALDLQGRLSGTVGNEGRVLRWSGVSTTGSRVLLGRHEKPGHRIKVCVV